jgi:hypothetical protein
VSPPSPQGEGTARRSQLERADHATDRVDTKNRDLKRGFPS